MLTMLSLLAFFAAPKLPIIESAQASPAPLADRLRNVTTPFIGAPYRISPLGEGSGKDKDPRIRFDAFDCTTFVETAMALALTDDMASARKLLDEIRYRNGNVDFINRRHFPEAEWIPELVEAGYLHDITRDIAGKQTKHATKTLNAKVWAKRKRPSHLQLPDSRIPDGIFGLDFWPLDQARAGQKRIPPGAILNLVRVDFRSVPVRVSHQGLIIEKQGQLFMRHAADRMYHSVVDEALDHFLSRMQKYKRWPVAGINLVRVQKPGRK